MKAEIHAWTSRVGPRRPRAQDIDRHIGARLRQQRIMNGLTQQKLADLIGVTYQQAHKYENGVNRIAAGRLYIIAQVLGVDIGYFFEGLQSAAPSEPSPQQRVFLDLARNFRSIRTPKPGGDLPAGADPGQRRERLRRRCLGPRPRIRRERLTPDRAGRDREGRPAPRSWAERRRRG